MRLITSLATTKSSCGSVRFGSLSIRYVIDLIAVRLRFGCLRFGAVRLDKSLNLLRFGLRLGAVRFTPQTPPAPAYAYARGIALRSAGLGSKNGKLGHPMTSTKLNRQGMTMRGWVDPYDAMLDRIIDAYQRVAALPRGFRLKTRWVSAGWHGPTKTGWLMFGRIRDGKIDHCWFSAGIDYRRAYSVRIGRKMVVQRLAPMRGRLHTESGE